MLNTHARKLIKALCLISPLLAQTSFAASNDLSGLWSEPSRAIIFVIETINNKPTVVNTYLRNNAFCIIDNASTQHFKTRFMEASRIDVTGDTMFLYKLSIDYPNRVRTLFKLKQLPANCLSTLKTNDPKLNFEVLWSFFNDYYPAITQRLPNGYESWQDLYAKYSKQLTPNMSKRALFQLMGKMLGELRDEHVNLYFEGNPKDDLDINNDSRVDVSEFNKAFAQSYDIQPDAEDFINIKAKSITNNIKAIDTRYLEQAYHGPEMSAPISGLPSLPVYTWGIIKNTRIAYLRILQELDFENDSLADRRAQFRQSTNTIDQLMLFFKAKNINKLIIDIRVNLGGDSEINDYLIQYLITDRRVVSQTQEVIEKIPQPLKPIYLQANNHPLRTKNNLIPIIVLISNQTFSAGEELTLELKALENVTLMGYPTNGVFGSAHDKTLPNGWIFVLPFDKTLSHDGTYYEGIGIPPDVQLLPADNYLIKKYNENQIDIILDKIIKQ